MVIPSEFWGGGHLGMRHKKTAVVPRKIGREMPAFGLRSSAAAAVDDGRFGIEVVGG